MTNTYTTLPFGPGSVALNTRQPCACSRTRASVVFSNAACRYPMTISKSTTRSGRTALKMRPVLLVKVRAPSGTGGTTGGGTTVAGPPGAGAGATGAVGPGAGAGCWTEP